MSDLYTVRITTRPMLFDDEATNRWLESPEDDFATANIRMGHAETVFDFHYQIDSGNRPVDLMRAELETEARRPVDNLGLTIQTCEVRGPLT